MEDMKYITQANVLLSDISECLTNRNLKAHLYHDELINEKTVIVYFEMVYEGKVIETFCWWYQDDIEGQEHKQIVKYRRKDPELKYLFDITYNPGTMSELYKVLEHVLGCFGGYVYCEGRFFDKNTIPNLRNVKLGQRIRQRKDIPTPYVYYYVGSGPLKVLDVYKAIR